MSRGQLPFLPADAIPLPALMRPAELARRWRITTRTLERWRAAGTGPAWLRVGAYVRYRSKDVLAFEEAQLRRGQGAIR